MNLITMEFLKPFKKPIFWCKEMRSYSPGSGAWKFRYKQFLDETVITQKVPRIQWKRDGHPHLRLYLTMLIVAIKKIFSDDGMR